MTHQYESTATLSIHGNHTKEPLGAVVHPIYQTSTFEFDNCDQGGNRFAGKEDGFIYTRLGNPTTRDLEKRVAVLEGAEDCAVAASGMGAIASTVLTLLKAGDHLLADDTLYGCTHSLFEHQLTKFGIDVQFVDMSNIENVRSNMKENTRIVYIESPGNPTMKIVDIKAVSEIAHNYPNAVVVVDNTFCSPIIQKPLSLGADIVVHSMTKYINGHTDVVAGCVCGTNEMIARVKGEGIKDLTGAVISPHDAWLVIRGMLTLHLRVTQASENAMKVAQFLQSHPAVEHVYYPGLETHKGHDIAQKQMKLFGSMMSFELKGGLEAGKRLLDNLHLITLAVSLGGCESLIQHPASMTHACVPREERIASGLTDGLIRLSVGIEEVDDIIADLKHGLDIKAAEP